jgi:cell division protein FtsQ
MKKFIIIFQLLFLCALFTALLSFTLKSKSSEVQTINSIDIKNSGDSFVNENQLYELLKYNGLIYEEQEVFDISSMELVINNQPQIKDAQVFLNLNGSVDISIKERNPILRVFESNSSYYLDEECYLMPLSDSYTSRNLIASGDINDFKIEDICSLSKFIEADEFLKSLISQIHFQKNNTVLITRIKNHNINIGNLDLIEVKFDNLMCFYNNIIKYKGWDYYSSISLKYTDQIICSKN